MKRFIDIRGQGTGYRFAWFDTGTDKFETHSDTCCWDTFDQFAKDCAKEDLKRYESLTPDWAKIEDKEDKLWKDDE